MELWLVLSIIVIVVWGFWGFALKYASLSLEWYHVYVASAMGALSVYLIATLALAYLGKLSTPATLKGLAVAVTGGLLGALGGLMLVVALRMGEASIVVPLTSVYPAVTAILSIILLGEDVTVKKILGVTLAILAVILLSTSE